MSAGGGAGAGAGAGAGGDVDVAVVGAGLAGLEAARRLRRAGASVVVLEARDRVGGRTVNQRVGKAEFDLGGQWMGPTQERVARLAAELGVRTFPTHGQGIKLLDVGGKVRRYKGTIPAMSPFDLLFAHGALSLFERMARQVPPEAPWAAKRAAEWDATTLEAFKRRVPSRIARESLDAAVRVVFGVEPSELSLLHFLFYARSGGGFMKLVEVDGGAQQERFVGGSHRLSAGLAQALGDAVVLGAPVGAITQDAGGVTLHAGRRTVRARFAILALPPALAGRIAYDPPMPAVRDQLTQRVPMGAAIKVVVTYERAFWRDEGLSGEAVSGAGPLSVTFDNTTHDGVQPALVGFVAGRHAREMSVASAAQRRRALIHALVRLFGRRAAEPTDLAELDWHAEPWSRGCPVGVMGPGTLTQLAPALREPVGRLHWAGTETATRWCGYMEGALESGERAAAEVARRL